MDPKAPRWGGVVAGVVLTATACAGGAPEAPSAASTTVLVTTTSSKPVRDPIRVALRIDRRVADAATEGFVATVEATLTDPRGWERAGFEFTFAEAAPFTVVLAQGNVVDELCRPYDVGGRFSCQNGPVVALNADRWREATPQWPAGLDSYRQMLVNHEVGHLLGQHHPARQCPTAGAPAPVMAQQSTELGRCLPNPWPLPWEVACAARHQEPLAPPYADHPTPTCRPPSQ